MVKKSNEWLLSKIANEISEIEQVVNHITYEKFVEDFRDKKTVVMSLINIGELAKFLSDDIVATSNIPFRKIIGLRNRAAHGYLDLKFDQIWVTATQSLPELKIEVEKLIQKII